MTRAMALLPTRVAQPARIPRKFIASVARGRRLFLLFPLIYPPSRFGLPAGPQRMRGQKRPPAGHAPGPRGRKRPRPPSRSHPGTRAGRVTAGERGGGAGGGGRGGPRRPWTCSSRPGPQSHGRGPRHEGARRPRSLFGSLCPLPARCAPDPTGNPRTPGAIRPPRPSPGAPSLSLPLRTLHGAVHATPPPPVRWRPAAVLPLLPRARPEESHLQNPRGCKAPQARREGPPGRRRRLGGGKPREPKCLVIHTEPRPITFLFGGRVERWMIWAKRRGVESVRQKDSIYRSDSSIRYTSRLLLRHKPPAMSPYPHTDTYRPYSGEPRGQHPPAECPSPCCAPHTSCPSRPSAVTDARRRGARPSCIWEEREG